MKLKSQVLYVFFFAIACSTEEVDIAETVTLETISLNQKLLPNFKKVVIKRF